MISESELPALFEDELDPAVLRAAKHELTFGAAASPSIDHQTISIAIDDLLPLP